MGTDPGDRYRSGGDGFLPRLRDDLRDSRPAHRALSEVLLRSPRTMAEGLHHPGWRAAVQALGLDGACTHRRREARKALGPLVPTDPAEIRKSIGMGWWKYDVKAAEQLLLSKGFNRDNSKMWLKPDGQPWKIR